MSDTAACPFCDNGTDFTSDPQQPDECRYCGGDGRLPILNPAVLEVGGE